MGLRRHHAQLVANAAMTASYRHYVDNVELDINFRKSPLFSWIKWLCFVDFIAFDSDVYGQLRRAHQWLCFSFYDGDALPFEVLHEALRTSARDARSGFVFAFFCSLRHAA